MSTDERSLGDKTDETSVEVERGPLSVDEFLQGVRAQRRSVKIRPRADLYATLEQLGDEIDAAPEGEDVDDLLDEYERLGEQFMRTERWTVEQRTPERRRHVRREAAKEIGVEISEDGERPVQDDPDRTQAARLEAHVIADHIVEPEGVTAAQVRALYDASPGEYAKIDRAVVQVMRVIDEEAAAGVLRDFSSRRSGKTAGSTKR